jgi:alpha-1,2-mannosyltransferase
VPYLVEEVIFAAISSKSAFADTVFRFFRGGVAALVVLALELGVSSLFYAKLELVPLNIVLYNVFAGPGRGPNIYGTEPWHFYIRNLLLNFNIWFILALLSLPLFLLSKLLSGRQQSAQTGLRTVVFMSPFYLWLAIFTVQPHKEERFMFPAYPALALNAAMALHIILVALGNSDPKTLVGKIPARLKLVVVVTAILGSVNLGIARIYSTYDAYSAPLSIYAPLEDVGHPGDVVCLGKEWYRFPTSYFLPNGMHAHFIKSAFSGLLPGQFAEAGQAGLGHRPGTWMLPSGMNDQNLEDPGKYVDIRSCDFLVDSLFEGQEVDEGGLEPAYVRDEENWEVVKCAKFLDAGKTPTLGRTIWVPESFQMGPLKRVYGKHCLLKRKRNVKEVPSEEQEEKLPERPKFKDAACHLEREGPWPWPWSRKQIVCPET